MQEEIVKYGFKNTRDFIRETATRTGAQHYIECGLWYGTIMRDVEDSFLTSTGYEALTEIAHHASTRVRGRVVNEVLVKTIRPEMKSFWIDPTRSMFTSTVFNGPQQGREEHAIGNQVTFESFVSRHREELMAGVLKSNIEGLDIDLVLEIQKQRAYPLAMLFEVNGGLVHRLPEIWPDLAHNYKLPCELQLDGAYPHHIGVVQGMLYVSQVGSQGRHSLTRLRF